MARILQVCNTDFYLEKFLKPLVLELQRRGHEVECVCSGRGYSSDFALRKIPIHDFTYPAKASPWAFVGAIRAFGRLLRTNKYDCVNSHNRNSSIVARIASWRARVPLNVYTAHGMYFHDAQGPLARYLTEVFEGVLSRITTFTLSQSDEDTKLMVRNGRIRRDKIESIGNGINTEKFSPHSSAFASLPGPSPGFRVAALGRLVQGKGFDDLIRAFHRFQEAVPGSELIFIGGNIEADFDSSAQGMKRLIEELGITEKVRITGIVSNPEDYLLASDVFVHPSYREGIPRSLLEAMCVGLPVLATAIRGAREIIRDGETGFLFAPRDERRITELLLQVHRMGAEGRRELGQRARGLVLKDFDENKYVARQADAIERLVDGRRERNENTG